MKPVLSPFLSKDIAGTHAIQGIGARFIPEALNTNICDEIETVTDEDVDTYAKEITREGGLLVGISFGAALKAAFDREMAGENKGNTVVALLLDSGDRYYLRPLFQGE